MKPDFITLAVVSAALMATPALAQSQSAAEPTVAATLPGAFEGSQQPAPSAAPRQAAPPSPVVAPASAADIAKSETALRAVISELQSGTIDYSRFSDDLATQVREQADAIGSLLTQFGSVQSITHKGQPQGAELFEVQFENQKSEWVIGFDSEDKIAALLFRPAES